MGSVIVDPENDLAPMRTEQMSSCVPIKDSHSLTSISIQVSARFLYAARMASESVLSMSGRTSVGEKSRPSADQRDVCNCVFQTQVHPAQQLSRDRLTRYLVSKTFPVSLSHYKVSNDSLDMYTFAVYTCLVICFQFCFRHFEVIEVCNSMTVH
ncbi:hypothetical protein KCV07_g232, partial [Aureobasidium melanogenum]